MAKIVQRIPTRITEEPAQARDIIAHHPTLSPQQKATQDERFRLGSDCDGVPSLSQGSQSCSHLSMDRGLQGSDEASSPCSL